MAADISDYRHRFRRDKDSIVGVVNSTFNATQSHDTHRVDVYADGEKTLHLTPEGMKKGDQILNSEDSPASIGNCLPLAKIPVGVCAALKCGGRGDMLVRSLVVRRPLSRDADWANQHPVVKSRVPSVSNNNRR